MAEEKRKRRSFFTANIPQLILSVFLAMVLWLVLSMTVFPDMTVFLYDVPIDYSLEGSYASLAGLSVIQNDIDQVNLTFTGRRDAMSSYTNDDIHVRVNLETVRGSGTYTLPLIVESDRGDRLENLSVVPDAVHITFDKISTKTLSVADGTLVANISNISAEQGYIIDPTEVEITPSEITISGPQDYISQVTSCVLNFDSQLSLRSTRKLRPSGYTLYNGVNLFESQEVTLSSDDFSVNVPVYMTKELPLNVVLNSYTPYVDASTVPYRLSTETIKVRSEDNSIANIKDINLGIIDIRDVVPGSVKTIEIPQNSHYTNISGVDTVNVNFDLEGYADKDINLTSSQIHPINGPDGYDVTIEQNKLQLKVVGPAEVLETLDASNFVGQIDLMDYSIRPGVMFLSVTVYAPGHPDVWVVGRNNQVLTSIELAAESQNEDAE